MKPILGGYTIQINDGSNLFTLGYSTKLTTLTSLRSTEFTLREWVLFGHCSRTGLHSGFSPLISQPLVLVGP